MILSTGRGNYMIDATLISGKVSSNSSEAHALFAKSTFGEKSNQKIIYSNYEALYLSEESKIKVQNFQGKPIERKDLERKFSRIDKNFKTNYSVFKDLRKKGYIVKTALKFGGTFRIYEKGKNIGKSHSKWICFPVDENSKILWQDFTAKNRVAHSTKKNLLIAIVDEENSISYFEISWIKA